MRHEQRAVAVCDRPGDQRAERHDTVGRRKPRRDGRSAEPQPDTDPEPPDAHARPAATEADGVKFDTQVRTNADESMAEITQTVTWRAPLTKDLVIRVYGVTECLAQPPNPSPATSGPCLVEHTQLPASVRRLLATAPASEGSASWTWSEETGCNPGLPNAPDGPAYYAVVLAAYSAADHSIFAIAEPGGGTSPVRTRSSADPPGLRAAPPRDRTQLLP